QVLEVFDDRASERFPALIKAHLVARRANERLMLSATHTVVALAGFSGSGKSSLYNALSGLELSAVGKVTGQPQACIWGPKGADELLAWLGVDPAHQVPRESALDADTQARLRGLILLDLPDYDSLTIGHRQAAQRVIDRADLLIWVTDPMRYMDIP